MPRNEEDVLPRHTPEEVPCISLFIHLSPNQYQPAAKFLELRTVIVAATIEGNVVVGGQLSTAAYCCTPRLRLILNWCFLLSAECLCIYTTG